jgi:cobalt transporter subunit CbtA
MLFRRLIAGALAIGVLAGLLLTIVQQWGVTPLILAAETFEESGSGAAADAHGHAGSHGPAPAPDLHHSAHSSDPEPEPGHSHDPAASWAPAAGAERLLFTLLANVLAGIGFAAVLLALMTQAWQWNLSGFSVRHGWRWGGAGFFALFLYPALGLPPEIPGMEAAGLENRQGWWLLAVLGAAVGLALLAFAPLSRKWLATIPLSLPWLPGAPSHSGAAFAHADPRVVAQLTELHQQFIGVSLLTNLVFWLALGMLSAAFAARFLVAGAGRDEQ